MPITAEFSTATTLRPGLLVGVKTSIKGNVKYHKRDINQELVEGSETAQWETTRTTKDAAEQAAATEVRSQARRLIERVCSKTEFGLLCPTLAAPDLEKAIEEARALCAKFNKDSKYTKVRFGAITGRVAADDLQAARALRREISELIGDMKEGLEQLDVDTVRAAATRVKQLGQMLTPEAQARATIAVEQARSLARRIVKAGETGAQEIDARTIATLTEARTAFLDLDTEEGEIGKAFVEGRAIDLTPDNEVTQAAPAAPVRELVA